MRDDDFVPLVITHQRGVEWTLCRCGAQFWADAAFEAHLKDCPSRADTLPITDAYVEFVKPARLAIEPQRLVVTPGKKR